MSQPLPPADPSAARLAASCRTRLTRWSAPDDGQRDLRQSYLAYLDEHPDGWRREAVGAHLTASALICAVEERRVLLTLHRRIGRWLQTGGHLEPTDADLDAAALREATEESGLPDLRLDPDPLLLSRHEVPCGTHRPTYHLDVQYLVRTGRSTVHRRSAESADLAWFPVDALPDTDDSVRDLVAAAGRRLGWTST